jgi:hypothetical protein
MKIILTNKGDQYLIPYFVWFKRSAYPSQLTHSDSLCKLSPLKTDSVRR